MEQCSTQDKLLDYLLTISRWGKEIYPFLKEQGYRSDQTESDEKKSLRSLHDTDTTIMAVLVCHRHYENLSPFNVSSLAKVMDSSSFDARKAMEMKIKRTLKSIAGYGLIDFEWSQYGNRPFIMIQPTDLLLDFFENKFFS